MFEIVKNVIGTGRYELTALLGKIDTLWVQGTLTDEQHDELVRLAQRGADIGNSVDVIGKLAELEARIVALENSETPGGETEEVYPDYVIGKWYYNGDKITYNGKRYVCAAPVGAVCTWNPDEYPAYWTEAAEPEEVTESVTEGENI